MKKVLTLLLAMLSLSLGARDMNPYSLIWNSPSKDASGSMPIGNGEVGANVWVEENGDILFYISRTDSWSETGELFKLGRIRVSVTPSLTAGGDFVQMLDLGKGRIRISGNGTALDFFIDSGADVIRLTGKAGKPVDVKVAAEVWRDKEFEITPELAAKQYRSISGFVEGQAHFKGYPDRIVSGRNDITVFHHNCESSYETTLRLEKLEPDNRASHDPFLDRCFGYTINMNGAEKVSDLELKTCATKRIDIKIATLTGKYKGGNGWTEAAKAIADAAPSAKAAMRRTARYWKKYWNKSYIEVQTPDVTIGERINSAYVFQEWIQACACRGHYPIKFNGTIFCVDPKLTDSEQDFGPDYRRWGGDFWWQNTRLPYHPMLKSGDFDMMMPLFKHYFGNLDMMKANARALCSAEGALSPETQTIFGTFSPADFYWDRENSDDNMPHNMYIKMHWDSSVEMIALMLDYWDYTRDEVFVKTILVPYAREMLSFYESFYKIGTDGRLEITPTQSLETYWYDVVNDMPTVAGLHEATARLLKLPAEFSSDADKNLWKRLEGCLPDLPVANVDGKDMFRPAKAYKDVLSNVENPEMYPVFPFHLCNISTGNTQLGIEAFKARIFYGDRGWYQDGQQAARLGLVEEARELLIKKLDYSNNNFRFPVIWGPNFDWTPDQDHGSNFIMNLQDMVLQTYDGVDYILPAFPEDWGVKYKLYSFGGKVVKGSKKMKAPFETQILSYKGNKVKKTYVFDSGELASKTAGRWSVDVKKTKVSDEATDYALTFTMKEGEMTSGGAAVQFEFDDWSTDNYIFAPCHLYDGNRFRILPVGYAPFIYDEKDRPLDMPVTTTNVPHFNSDGSDATVDFKTNSCSTPLAGFFDKSAKRAFFILTEQDTVLGDNAFFISEHPSDRRLTIRLSAPGVRKHRYTMCNADNPSDDTGIALKSGDEIKMHFRVYDFACGDIPAMFDKFLTIRKDLSGQNELRNLEPFSSIHSTIFAHHFVNKWYEDKDFGYDSNKPWMDSRFAHLQLAWNGPPALTLMQLANPHPDYDEILRRIGRTFDSIEYMQRESGIFNGIMMKGQYYGDDFDNCEEGNRDVSMIRRTAMTIYFSLQCFDMMRLQGRSDMIKPSWEESMRRACDALCTLFNRYGEFGQMVYACTGDIYTPNSTAGALAMGALAYASRYFNNPDYLKLAEKAGDHYYENHLAKGYVGGGPPEILQAPDSEASGELAESFTALYEITRDDKWLKRACDAAAYFSSWVVSYDYRFPDTSTFGKHDVKASGSVWASVQNEHSAPGIYVLSGDFLLKLYRRTGDKRYLELDRDMAHNIVQYVNTENNRIQSEGGPGYVTERVNIGDWEGVEGIGNIPDNDSNISWENTTLFHTTENPGIYVQPDKGEITVFDHVNARIVSSDSKTVTLEIQNPTYRDGDFSVLAETSSYARENSLGWNAFHHWPKVHVPSGRTVTVTLPYSKI